MTADARATRPKLVLGLACLAAVGVVAGALLAFPAASRVGFTEIYATDLMIGASFTTIGVLVARRRPENPMGWLFLVIGVVQALVAGLNHYAIVGLTQPSVLPGARWLGYWLVSLVVPSGLFLLLLILFPDGRPISTLKGAIIQIQPLTWVVHKSGSDPGRSEKPFGSVGTGRPLRPIGSGER